MGEAEVKLSILIATITERADSYFPDLVKELRFQIGDRKDVEIIGFLDNRMRTVGEKRQDLLDIARGEYVVFFDDDDTPAPDYVSSIMSTLEVFPDTDSVVFDVKYTHLGSGKEMICKYDKDFRDRGVGPDGIWRGPSCHVHVTKSEIAKSVKWLARPPGKRWNLDEIWANAVVEKIQTQARVDKVLYYYNFNPGVSETLKRDRQIEGR